MSVTQQTLAVGRGLGVTRPARRAWHGGLQGSDYVWAIAFAVPYALVFLAFVLYPICYGLYLGGQPELYSQLFADPRYLTAVFNTVIYVGVGVNLKMLLAFLLSGFFMRKGWWTKVTAAGVHPAVGHAGTACLHVDPLDDERSVGHVEQCSVHAVRYRRSDLLERSLVGARGQHRCLYLEDLAVLDDHPAAGRMAVPQELYEAASVDGANRPENGSRT